MGIDKHVKKFLSIIDNGFGLYFLERKIVFKILPTKVGKKCAFNGRIKRVGRGNVVIGNNVKINSSINSNPLGGNCGITTFFAFPGSEIIIGNNVGISNSVFASYSKIVIENNVLIGAGVSILDSDFHDLNVENRGNPDKDAPISKPILIKQNAFIGAHSTILKGVTIGENAIIGACSVVTKSIPSNEIWAGNPAKFIRKIEEKTNENNA